MLMHKIVKIIKKINRRKDTNLTRLLLKNIKSADINASKHIFIFNQLESTYYLKLYALVSYELSKRGIASYFLYKDDLLSPYYPEFKINGYEISNAMTVEKRGLISSSHSSHSNLFFEWIIDIENEKIESRGINFFYIITSTLRKIQKRYNVFLEDQNNTPVYNDLIKSCDLLLKYFLLFKEYAIKNEKKIRLVGFETTYIPNGVWRILCDQLSTDRDVEYIELRRGYIYYFGNHHIRDSYITSENLTKTKLPVSFTVSRDAMSEFDDNAVQFAKLAKPISNALDKKIYDKAPESQQNIIKIIKTYQSQGKNVFCLFAHLFYDTPIEDSSTAFHSMCEWISETVNYFKDKEDLLLIKPHPAEFEKDQPQKTPNETLASFLSNTELPENILLLEQHQFTIKDLNTFISCGLIWRSSVGMELTFLGVPNIIAGTTIYNSLDLNYAKDKEHYFHMLTHAADIKVLQQQKKDVAKYLYLLERKHIKIESISYHQNYRKFYWNRKELLRHLKSGSENISSVVDASLL
jgi:hypothetical protein